MWGLPEVCVGFRVEGLWFSVEDFKLVVPEVRFVRVFLRVWECAAGVPDIGFRANCFRNM